MVGRKTSVSAKNFFISFLFCVQIYDLTHATGLQFKVIVLIKFKHYAVVTTNT